MKIPLTILFNPKLEIAKLDSQLAELIALGQYEIAPAYIIKDGQQKLVCLSLVKKKHQ